MMLARAARASSLRRRRRAARRSLVPAERRRASGGTRGAVPCGGRGGGPRGGRGAAGPGSGAASTSSLDPSLLLLRTVSYQTSVEAALSLPALRAVSCQAAGGDGEPVVEAADSRGVYQRSSSRRAVDCSAVGCPSFGLPIRSSGRSDACYGCLRTDGIMALAPSDEWHL